MPDTTPRSTAFLGLLTALFALTAAVHGQSFQVGTLTADACQVVEHRFNTGDDRGPIAVGAEHVLYTGDGGTARFDLEDLGGATSFGDNYSPIAYDALTSNLRTGQIFTLAYGETPLLFGRGTATALLEIDPGSGRPSGTSILLSRPVRLTAPVGFFAGWDRVALHSGDTVWDVDLRTGRVRSEGPLALPGARLCEIGAFWGVAEFFDGGLHLVYREVSGHSVVRTRVRDGATTTLAAFDHLGDLCALSVSPQTGRWYFHHEFFSEFDAGDELLGFCAATTGPGPRAELSLSHGELPDAVAAGTSFPVTFTVENGGPARAPGARLDTRLPTTVEVLSATPSQGSCRPGCRNFACELGGLAPGAEATVTLELRPRAGGALEGVTRVGSRRTDGEPEDNTVAWSLDVEGAPRVLVALGHTDHLLVLDPRTGGTRTRIPLYLPDAGIVVGRALATHPATGELWALLDLAGQDGTELVTLDPHTGEVRRVGDTGHRSLDSLTIDAEGRLWAQAPEGLVVLDPETAAPRVVAPFEGVALAFGDGRLVQIVDRETLRVLDPGIADAAELPDVPTRALRDAAACGSSTPSRLGDEALVHLGGDSFLAADHLLNLHRITADGQRTAVGFLDHTVAGLAWIDPPEADLAVTQSAAPETTTVGTPLTYTVTVENRGPETTSATLFDTLPATASLLEARLSRGTCRGDDVFDLVCRLGELASGELATVELEVTPWAAGTIVHTAEVLGFDDPDPSDNVDTRTTEVRPVDDRVLVSINFDGQSLRILEPTTGATRSSRRIVLPDASVVGANGLAVDPETGELWTLMGFRDPYLVTLDPRTGLASIVGQVGYELEALAFSDDGTLWGVTNADLQRPHALFVLDPADAATTFVVDLVELGNVTSGGTALAFNPVDGRLWAAFGSNYGTTSLLAIDLATLEVEQMLLPVGANRPSALTYLGGDLSLLYEANVVELRTVSTAGEVRRVGRLDHISRGLAFVSGLPRPRLAVTQSADRDPAVVSRRLGYTVTVTNMGDEPVDGVVLSDELPGIVSLRQATPSRGTCTSDGCGPGLVCELGRLEAGESATVELRTRALAPGTVTNTARVEPVFGDDDVADNVSTISTQVRSGGPSSRTLLSLGTLASGMAEAVHLHVVDPSDATTRSTLEVTLEAGPAIVGGRGLAAHPDTGELWALLALDGPSEATELVTLDPHTGRARRAATLDGDFDDLAFDATGTLYGLASSTLFVIDRESGATTVLASLAAAGGSIAWIPSLVPLRGNLDDGRLYHAAGGLLETIDPADGRVTPVATCSGLFGGALVHGGEEVLLLATANTFEALLERVSIHGGRAPIGELDHASSGLAWVDLARGDLAVTQGVAPRRGQVGEPLTLTVRVENRGATAIPHAGFVDRLPGSVRVDAVSATRGGCEVEGCGGVVRCDLGSLDAGARTTVRITATPLAAGTFDAEVTAPSLDDPDLTDNQVTTTIRVDARDETRALLALDAEGGRLRIVDPGTAETLVARDLTVVGETVRRADALAVHPATGELFTLLELGDHRTELAAVHPDTGVVRLVGDPAEDLVDLVFGADGTLYGVTEIPPALFTVDLDDASTTFVTGLASGGATAFHRDEERLYHLLSEGGDRLLRAFDPASGTASDTLVCPDAAADALVHFDGGDFLAAAGDRLDRISITGVLATIGHLDAAPAGLAFAASPPLARLTLTQSAAPDPAIVGAPLTYTLNLENAGPDDISGSLTLIESLPPSVTLRGLSASRGGCRAGLCGEVACDLGGLGAGETATVTLDTVPWAAGSVTSVAEVPVLNDPEIGDNRSELVTEVEPASRRRLLVSIERFGQLFIVDPLDGSTLSRRTVTLEDGTTPGAVGLAVHPRTGVLWVLLGGREGSELATLDPLTGLARPVGSTGGSYTTLAFDLDGNLYSVLSGSPRELAILSLIDASATPVLELDTSSGGEALGFHPDSGLLFRVRNQLALQSIDPGRLVVEEIPACPRDSFLPTALTHAGGDTFFLADDNSVLYTLTTRGVFRQVGRLEQRSRGLAFVDVAFADLEVSQTLVGGGAPTTGEPLTVRVTVTNHGPDDVAGAALVDRLPGIASLEAIVPSQGTCRRVPCGADVVCELGLLAVGASATVDLEMTPHLAGPLVNEASIPVINDPEPANNVAMLAVEIASGPDSETLFLMPAEGDRLYAIDAVSGTEIGSIEIRLGSNQITGGRGLARHPATSELWALLELAGRRSSMLAVIDPATGVARQVGSTGDEFRGLAFDGSDNLWSVFERTGLSPQPPEELHRLSTVDAAPTFVATFETVSRGEALAWNPADGLLYRATGSFNVEAIDPESGGVIGEGRHCNSSQIEAAAHLGGDVLLLAERHALYGYSTTGNLVRIGTLAREPAGLAFAELRDVGSLAVSQRDTPDPVTVGETLTYTVEVVNEGTESVADVSVVDRLPGTVSLLSATASRGACRSEICGSVVCDAGDLAGGERATFSLEVTPLVPGTVSNTTFVPVFDSDVVAAVETTEVVPAGRRPAIISLAGDTLHLLDPGDGSTVASIALEIPGAAIEDGRGLTVDPVTGHLWALAQREDENESTLLVIDPRNGEAESLSQVNPHLSGLAFDDAGTLWTVSDSDHGPASLHTLDPATGMSTAVIELGQVYDRHLSRAKIAWNPADGLLYIAFGSLELKTVDPRSLDVREVAACGRAAASGFAHLGRDVLLLAGGSQLLDSQLLGMTTAGGLAAIGDLDHVSGGLAVLDDLPLADLRVTQSTTSSVVVEGGMLTWTVAVTSEGPDPVSGVRLFDDLPATVSLRSAVASQGSCGVELCGALICDLGTLAAGDVVTVALEARALTAGEANGQLVTNLAAVTFLGDVDPDDNRSESAVTVLPDAAPRTLLSLDATRPILRRVDPTTGATLASLEIVLPGSRVEEGRGLAVNPRTGEVRALLSLDDHGSSFLVTLDPRSGVARLVGDTGSHLLALAVADDGTHYAVEEASLSGYPDERLVVLDPRDATPTQVLDFGEGEEGEGLAFNPTDGRLYRVSGGLDRFTRGFELSVITLETPAEATIAACGGTADTVGALAYLGDDVLLLADRDGRELFAVTTAGGLARVGTLDHGSQGLVFIPRLPSAADLSVTQSAEPDPAVAGERLTYTTTVSNAGTEGVDGVTLLSSLPGAVAPQSITASQGSCAAQACGGFTCDLGTLGAGAASTVTLVVTPLVAGTLRHDVVAPALGDTAADDNASVLETVVEGSSVAGPLLSIDQEAPLLRILDPADGTTLATRTITDDATTGDEITGGHGLAAHPETGEIWAVLGLGYGSGQVLVTLDPRTGAATRRAAPESPLTDLAFDAAGTLWAVVTGPQLAVVDPADGSTRVVAPLNDRGHGAALAFNPVDGRFVHASEGPFLESVDPVDGSAVEVAQCHFGWLGPTAATHLGSGTLLLALNDDHDSDGLWAVTTDGGLALLGSLDHVSGGLALLDLPRADLVVSQTAAPDPAVAGEALTYTVTVTNNGPDDVPDPRLRDLPPALGQAEADDCVADGCGALECGLAPLPSGAEASLEIRFTPFFPGPLVNEAEAVALVDLRPEDNRSVLETVVEPGAVAAPSLVFADEHSDQLEAVDPVTGELRQTIPVVLLGDAPAVRGFYGLTVHPETGEVWTLLELDGAPDELATVDLATGIATRIGAPGVYRLALAFTNDGTLYGANGSELFVLSTDDASASSVLAFDSTGFGGLAFHPPDALLYTVGETDPGVTVLRGVDPVRLTVTDTVVGCSELFYFGADTLTYLGGDALLIAAHDSGYTPTLFRLTTEGDLARVRETSRRDVTGMALVSLP